MKKATALIFDDSDGELINKIFELAGVPYIQIFKMQQQKALLFDGMEIQIIDKSVKIDGKDIRLTKLEFSVLHYLARHPGWVQSKRQIFDAVWPPDSDAAYHTVEVAVYSLRKKIDPDISNPRFISTVPGHGYRFIGKKII